MNRPEREPVGADEWLDAIAAGRGLDWEGDASLAATPADRRRALHILDTVRRLHRLPTGPPSVEHELERGYEVLGELGRGSHGRVWLARDRALGRRVALKVHEGLAGGHGPGKRFLSEARVLASLDHPNVVRVHSILEQEGRVLIDLEYVEGRTLQKLVEADGPLAPEEAARVGIDLCRALAELHSKDLVHGDVKPANVMRATGGRIVLLDFGVARSGEAPSQGPAGTPRYTAPEVFVAGTRVDGRADLFSLGALLYWCVSAQPPFEGEELSALRENVLAGRPSPLLDRRPDVPGTFAEIVERCLAPLDRRFASAGALEQALREFLQGRRARRQRAGALLLVAAVVVLAGLLWRAGQTGAPELSLEAGLYAVTESGSRRLSPQEVLHPGDQLVMELESERDLYVYVFNEDDEGRMVTLFPIPGFDLANPLPGGRRHRLPGGFEGRGQTWRVTSSGGGGESFFLVAAPEPVAIAEELAARIPPARAGAPMGAGTVTASERGSLLRSVGGLAPAPAGAGGEVPGTRLSELFPALGEGRFSAQGVVARQIRLRNEPR